MIFSCGLCFSAPCARARQYLAGDHSVRHQFPEKVQSAVL